MNTLSKDFKIIRYIIYIGIVVFFINIITNDSTDNEEINDPYTYTSFDKNCEDFATQSSAQLFYDTNGGAYSDTHDLDRDNDGLACE